MRLSTVILIIAVLAVVQFAGCAKLLNREKVKETPDTTEFAVPMDGIAGSYEGGGVNPGGTGSYDCTVEITRASEGYTVVWYFDGQPGYEGSGILKDNTLVVGFANAQGYGVVAYTVNPDGSLDGTWTGQGNPETGTETLRKK